MKVKHSQLILVVAAVFMLLSGACGKNAENELGEQSSSEVETSQVDDKETESSVSMEQTEIPDKYAAVVYVTINPELALYLDEDSKVIAAEYLNDDAAEAFSEISLDNLSVEEAMKVVIETAVDKGFLTEGKTVQIDVEEAEGEAISAEELIEKVENAIAEQLMEEEVESDMLLSIDGEAYISSAETPSSETTETMTSETCEACGGTGVCPECGGGTFACKRCGGSLWESCSVCNGSGTITCHGCHGSGKETSHDGTVYEEACHHCGGSGIATCDNCGGTKGKSCSICNGTGHMGSDCIVCHGDKKCTVCGGTGKK